jgi:hypothetical protein
VVVDEADFDHLCSGIWVVPAGREQARCHARSQNPGGRVVVLLEVERIL